jgi:hypothetical protein
MELLAGKIDCYWRKKLELLLRYICTCYKVLLINLTLTKVHAKAKQNNYPTANARSNLSMVHWLEPSLDRVQNKNNRTKAKVARSRANNLCANTRTKICNLTKRDCSNRTRC